MTIVIYTAWTVWLVRFCLDHFGVICEAKLYLFGKGLSSMTTLAQAIYIYIYIYI